MRLAGALALAVGMTVLCGWILDVPLLRGALASGLPMRANAAAAIGFAGAGLMLLSRSAGSAPSRAGAALIGLAVAVLALATLGQDLAGGDLGIDQLLARDDTHPGAAIPGRMSPPTSFSLSMIGIAMLLSATEFAPRLRVPAIAALCATAILVGGIALLGRFSDRLLEIHFLNYSRIAVYAAAGIVLLGAGLLVQVSAGGGLRWSLDRATTGGFAIGMLAMVIAAGVSYQFARRSRDDAVQVNRTQDVLKELHSLSAGFDRFAVVSARYLVTRDESALERRERTKQATRRGIVKLEDLMREPAEREQLERIARLHERRIAMSDDLVADARRRVAEGRRAAAEKPSPPQRGFPALGVEIDRLLQAMLAHEYARLDQRERASEATSARTFLLLPLGVFFSLMLLSLALFFLNSSADERRGAMNALRRNLERLDVLHGIDRAIIAAKTPAQTAAAALPRLRELLGVPRVVVSLVDPAKGEAEWLAAIGRRRAHAGPGVRFPAGMLGDLDGLRRGEEQLVEVAALGPLAEAEPLLASGVRWYTVVPMIAGGELIGGLGFGGPSRGFSAEQKEIAREAAAQLAIAIAQWRLDERARRSDAQYRLLFENVPLGITMTSTDGAVRTANPLLAHMIGYASVDEALGALDARAGNAYVDPQARETYLALLRRDRVVRGFETELRRKDGSRLWVSLDGKVIDEERGGGSLLVSIVDDVTLRKVQEARIARLSRVKEMKSGVSSAVVRVAGRRDLLAEVCRVAVEQGGFRAAWVSWHDTDARELRPVASAGQVDGLLDVLDTAAGFPRGEQAGLALQVLRGGVSIVANDLRSAPGVASGSDLLSRRILSSMYLPLGVEGRTRGLIVLCADEPGYFDAEERALLDALAADLSFALTSQRRSKRLDYLAYYDPLTELPNRRLFQDRLAHSLHSRGGDVDGARIAVALLDLERFRHVNETLGRRAGDSLLREVGARLKRANDSAARIGVDTYGLVLRGVRGAVAVSRALEAILDACFDEPIRLGTEELRVACRSGVAVYPDDGGEAEVLLKNAEAALRRARREHERIVFYEAEMNARAAEALSIETRLRRAAARREFVLHYQPKVNLASGALVGVEALIRWQEPGGDLVPPGRFVPALEETGLIADVGRWAVEQAFAEANAWERSGLTVPRIAVNVSAIQLRRRDFIKSIVEEVARGGDHPDWLELELTESMLMHNVDDSTRKLSILRGMGVTVAIDDFGTGYSSLGYLSRLPVDALKIDRSFVANVAATGDARSLVRTIVTLARGLKLKVVAEGVETREQAIQLRLLRCSEAQGYYFARPQPAGEIARLLRAGVALPAF